MSVCKAGCIGCKACEKVCRLGAIKVENNIAQIDYDKCVGSLYHYNNKEAGDSRDQNLLLFSASIHGKKEYYYNRKKKDS